MTDHAHGAPPDATHFTLRTYLTGFAVAAVLTAAAFWIVMARPFSATVAAVIVVMLAIAQIIVQTKAFLHVNARAQGGDDWLEMTTEQFDLIRTCGPDRRCMFIGDELVRMPSAMAPKIMKNAYDAATYAAIGMLGLKHSEELQSIVPDDIGLGDQFMTVTVTSVDGRTAMASGTISVRETLQ
jgi:heme/copper-type cytochrome/quinol oxidase subunit 4